MKTNNMKGMNKPKSLVISPVFILPYRDKANVAKLKYLGKIIEQVIIVKSKDRKKVATIHGDMNIDLIAKFFLKVS